jgi:hypothetical protein
MRGKKSEAPSNLISVLALTILLILPVGCGVSFNSSPQLSGTTSDPPVNTTPAGGQIVAVPGSFQALTGCANPNTGVSNGDWGVGSYPVYTTVSNTAPVVGKPIYNSNTVFWTSRENAPGQSILLAGAFTPTKKTARVAFVAPGTSDWQILVNASTNVLPTTQQGTTGLSFIVPPSFPPGVYGYELEDPSAPPVFGLANVPSISWAIGVPSVTDVSAALQHQVYDCGVESGGTLRLFGKNFTSSDQVILQSTGGVAYSLAPSKLDSNSIAAPVPDDLTPGTYNLWIGSAPWSATSSPAAKITVSLQAPLPVENVRCSNMVGDGATSNTASLQACLDRYAPPASGKYVVQVTVPAGTFVLTSGVSGHPFEVLMGESPSSTKFVGRPKGAPPAAWFSMSQHFALANFSLEAPANPNLLLSAGTLTGNPLTSGHIFVRNVNFASTGDYSNGAESMFALAGPDIQIYDSYFLSGSFQVMDIFYGDGAIVSGSNFVLNNLTGTGITDSQNIIFENNLTSSQNPIGQGSGGNSGGSGLSVSRGNNRFGPSALSRNVYIGYNTFKNMGSGDQQVITNDGDGGSYFGPIASSTANIVTLAKDPAWDWMGTTNPEASVMAIVFGRGVGQYSFVKSYSGRTITLSTPWQVQPDSTSVVVISQYELNMTVAHNTISNTLGASIVLGNALEGLIEENLMDNSGGGVVVSAIGPYGGPASYGPVMNNEVLRNTITVGAGTFIFRNSGLYLFGIGIQDFPGCLLSGLMVRGNIVPSVNTIYSTDGVNGISANVIELNEANWSPSFSTPGFLVQNNSPPAQ